MIKTETSVYINRVKFATKQIKNYLMLLDEINSNNVTEDIPDTTMEILNEIEASGTEIKELSGRIWMKWQGRKHETV